MFSHDNKTIEQVSAMSDEELKTYLIDACNDCDPERATCDVHPYEVLCGYFQNQLAFRKRLTILVYMNTNHILRSLRFRRTGILNLLKMLADPSYL